MDTNRFFAIYDSVPAAYYRWMTDLVLPHVRGRVLELGTGPGIVTRHLLEAGFAVTGVDRSRDICRHAEQAFSGHTDFTMVCEDLEHADPGRFPGAPFGAIVCLNLLEHIKDDTGLLERCRKALEPGGRVIVLVPAHPRLFGPMDEAFGHFRRYARRGLVRTMENAGFSVTTRYFNLLGLPGWWWRFRVRRARSFDPAQNRVYSMLLPVIRRAEAVLPPPVGLSILAVGTGRGA
ncbi:MAG: class I SAM-dependent methyltransferase [Desulfatibacillaceae bacterium]